MGQPGGWLAHLLFTMETAITFTTWLFNLLWPFTVAVIGVMVGSYIAARMLELRIKSNL
jgi:hypothetical protein